MLSLSGRFEATVPNSTCIGYRSLIISKKSKEKQLLWPFVLLERAGMPCRDWEFSFAQEVQSEEI
jgi:hypothetical protein